MANTRITVTFDSEKLTAIKQFAENGAQDIDTVLREQLEKIYTKTVPAPVRQYIDGKAKPIAAVKPKDKPKTDAPVNTSV